MRRDLEALAADSVELRRALGASEARRQVLGGGGGVGMRAGAGRGFTLPAFSRQLATSSPCLDSAINCRWTVSRCPAPQEAEGLVGELSEVVRQQKLRMRGLAQEKAEAAARLAAMHPQELERLRGELLALRERAGELGAIRDQLAQERRLAESLQQRLAGAQQALLEARGGAAARLAEAEAALGAGREEAARRAAAAEGAAAEARARAEQLAGEAQDLRDAVK